MTDIYFVISFSIAFASFYAFVLIYYKKICNTLWTTYMFVCNLVSYLEKYLFYQD